MSAFVYRLFNADNGEYYHGSTSETLEERLELTMKNVTTNVVDIKML